MKGRCNSFDMSCCNVDVLHRYKPFPVILFIVSHVLENFHNPGILLSAEENCNLRLSEVQEGKFN